MGLGYRFELVQWHMKSGQRGCQTALECGRFSGNLLAYEGGTGSKQHLPHHEQQEVEYGVDSYDSTSFPQHGHVVGQGFCILFTHRDIRLAWKAGMRTYVYSRIQLLAVLV